MKINLRLFVSISFVIFGVSQIHSPQAMEEGDIRSTEKVEVSLVTVEQQGEGLHNRTNHTDHLVLEEESDQDFREISITYTQIVLAQEEEGQHQLAKLPQELLVSILSFLDLRNLLKVSSVSNYWCKTVQQLSIYVLDLSKNKTKEGFLEKLLSDEKYSALTSLYLSSNKLGKREAAAIAACNLPSLIVLDLSDNELGNRGVINLMAGYWRGLTTLYLGLNKIRDRGIARLAAGNWPFLTWLYLGFNEIRDRGCASIAAGNFPSLLLLDMSDNKIESKGAESLAVGNLVSLRTLNLRGNKINDRGAASFVDSNLTALTTLNLHDNEIGDGEAKTYNGNKDAKRLRKTTKLLEKTRLINLRDNNSLEECRCCCNIF